MPLANARFTCSEMDESKTVAALRRSRFLAATKKGNQHKGRLPFIILE